MAHVISLQRKPYYTYQYKNLINSEVGSQEGSRMASFSGFDAMTLNEQRGNLTLALL